MVFWQMWEVAFQAFMIFIGVGIIWMRFIEPLFPSQQVSVILMIIVAVGLAVFRIALGVRGIRRGQKALQSQIAGLNEPAQEAK
jgi:divalent metal cation (Fe/Co/Zn/Cd) transporter